MAGEEIHKTTCCVVGGGPAGIMLGYLLARAGVAVTVLEKHQDFFRDFRGDTVHPSTLELLHELGILEAFLKLPHQALAAIGGVFGDFTFQAANFCYVPCHSKFVALMPQWDFLAFLSGHARNLPEFQLRMGYQAVGLLRDGGRITGVQALTPDGRARIEADLVMGCDGRHSSTRQAAGLEVQEFGVPIDVLWFRIARHPEDPQESLGNIDYGKVLILINRGDYFQAGFIIRKGSFEALQSRGMQAFRENIAEVVPFLASRLDELQDWNQIKLLTVQINRLKQWHLPGLLCIGDAAHAMSPAGGVGINLAIQDAVATANLLSRPLREKRVTEDLLAAVQKRRMFPTRMTQLAQINAHRGFEYIFRQKGPMRAPWQLKVALSSPGIQHVLGRLVGVGVRPEHIQPEDHPDESLQPVRAEWSSRDAAACAGLAIAVVSAAIQIVRLLRRRV